MRLRLVCSSGAGYGQQTVTAENVRQTEGETPGDGDQEARLPRLNVLQVQEARVQWVHALQVLGPTGIRRSRATRAAAMGCCARQEYGAARLGRHIQTAWGHKALQDIESAVDKE